MGEKKQRDIEQKKDRNHHRGRRKFLQNGRLFHYLEARVNALF